MIKNLVRNAFGWAGLEVYRKRRTGANDESFPSDFEPEFVDIIRRCRPYTMTTSESLYQLILCIRYLVENSVAGDLVECGVWRGGSVLAMIETLKMLQVSDRRLHLFDTFNSSDIFSTKAPTAEDKPFQSSFESMVEDLNKSNFDFSVNVDDVRNLMSATGYPIDKVLFHIGRVEDMIPSAEIAEIALLRLDTDWYDSTKFQLESLFGRVRPGGVVIFDDYGFWQGHKKAIDQFLSASNLHPLLIRTDWSCRFMIKGDT